MANFVEITDTFKSIVRHLNAANFSAMMRIAVAVPVTRKRHLDRIAQLIHDRALERPKFATLYAKLCAGLIGGGFDGSARSVNAFLTVLLAKCRDVLAKSCNTKAATDCTVMNRQTTYFVANCKFIGELYNLDVFPDSVVRSFLDDLTRGLDGSLQAQCLCGLLETAAPKLSTIESYSMTRVVGYLLLLANDTLRDEALPPTLKKAIRGVKNTHLMNGWIRPSADEPVNERLSGGDNNRGSFESFDYSLMSECIYEECWELLCNFVNEPVSRDGNMVERLLTPVIRMLLGHDRGTFVVSLVFASFRGENDKVRSDAGRLLADLVKAKRLSKFEVYLGFNKILHDDDANADCIRLSDLMANIRNEFEIY